MCAVDGGVCFLWGTSASARNANTRVLSSGRFFCRVDLRSYLSHSEATVKPSKSPCLPTFVGYSLYSSRCHAGSLAQRGLLFALDLLLARSVARAGPAREKRVATPLCAALGRGALSAQEQGTLSSLLETRSGVCQFGPSPHGERPSRVSIRCSELNRVGASGDGRARSKAKRAPAISAPHGRGAVPAG